MSFISRSVFSLIKDHSRLSSLKSVARRSYCQKFDGAKPFSKYTFRSHTCGELDAQNVGEEVTVCGWLQFQRMSQFAILRDAYGFTQVILPEERNDLIEKLGNACLESVILVKGKVKKRPDSQVNKNMSTGEVEVIADDFTVLNQSNNKLPFSIRDYQKANESLRMKYRYLDLRFPSMQRNLRLRSEILMKMRNFLACERGFVEVETPTLFKKTPGGAQEFIVPTQNRGSFYSLVQSPQQLKQLLMVGGIDRYFQVARCYRDETARPDRQPEFTQLDIELSFTNSEGVISLVEDLIVETLPKNLNLKSPFPRILYKESMEIYGTDQPDISITCKIEELKGIDLPKDQVAKFIKIPDSAAFLTNKTKTDLLKLKNTISQNASLNILKYPGSNWQKFAENLNGWTHSSQDLKENINLKEGELVFLSVGPNAEVLKLLGKMRTVFISYLRESGLTGTWEDKTASGLIWVVDFPLFEKGEDGEIKSAHHPFTSPHPEDVHLLDEDPLQVRGLHYDLVMNGWEIGGGSVRIHDPELQTRILKDILNIPTEEMEYLLEALGSGAPPHAGIALGIDRIMSILVRSKSIRDVIAFPKSTEAKDLMTGAPCPIATDELELYNIEVVGEKGENKNRTAL
ncbi:aspartate--tRNA ligase, mitochondrial isoform X2 [Cimex lectularius]|uniref:Aminoacyl-transfer RNA synthetases class-II family profile domain-containing protein n=1 Tax=Cimex lectularius TaxID=79782 RepID=A0A8I6RVU2_CIMLE|nr:aspartate--tRNA ligase, mitochondrial isoform X2 [Cimex lectularius]